MIAAGHGGSAAFTRKESRNPASEGVWWLRRPDGARTSVWSRCPGFPRGGVPARIKRRRPLRSPTPLLRVPPETRQDQTHPIPRHLGPSPRSRRAVGV